MYYPTAFYGQFPPHYSQQLYPMVYHCNPWICGGCSQCIATRQYRMIPYTNWVAPVPGCNAIGERDDTTRNSEELAQKSEILSLRLAGCKEEMKSDFELVNMNIRTHKLLQRIIEMLQEESEELQGQDIHKLLRALEDGNVVSNRKQSERGREERHEIYLNFLKGAESLVNRFIKKRNDIFKNNPKCEAKVAELKPLNQVSAQLTERRVRLMARLSKLSTKLPHNSLKSFQSLGLQESTLSLSKASEKMESSGLHELFTSSSTPDTTIMDSRKFGLAFIKIVDIKSGLNGFNIVAKIVDYFAFKKQGSTMLKCKLGDETGIVHCTLFVQEVLRKGRVLELRNLRSYEKFGKINLGLILPSNIRMSSRKIEHVNLTSIFDDDKEL